MEIPAPKSGLGFDLNRDVTTTELVSGGRSVYRTPLGYKSFNMSWSGGTAGLGEFMDMFEGAYGNGPFYILDPRSEDQNLLPARWASSWQLGHMANGWCRPAVNTQSDGLITPEGREVVFTGKANTLNPGADISPFRVLIPIAYGKTYSVKAWGTSTGGAQLRARPWVGKSPLPHKIVTLGGVATTDVRADYADYGNFVELTLYVPAGSTLTLRHIEMMERTNVSRTNPVPNPSFEVDTAGWSVSRGTMTSVQYPQGFPSFMLSGISCARLQATGTGTSFAQLDTAGQIPVVEGDPFIASASAYSADGQAAVGVLFYNAAGTYVSEWWSHKATAARELEVRVPVPPTAVSARVGLRVYSATGGNPNNGESAYFDKVMVGNTSYFDGDTPASNGKAYRWVGTPHNSVSEEYKGDGQKWHMGRGVGAVQFDGSMQGTLTSNKIDRIGLSVGMTEVES